MTGTEELWGPSRVLNRKTIMMQLGNAGGYDLGGDGGEVWRSWGRNTGSDLDTLIWALTSKQVDWIDKGDILVWSQEKENLTFLQKKKITFQW